jgi:hypothetical protein
MNRNEIVDARLFGAAGWPVDRESANRLQTTLLQMGLVEEVPGKADTWRAERPGWVSSFAMEFY